MQGLGGFPTSAAQSMSPAGANLPALSGQADQSMEVKKKGSALLIAAGSQSRSVSSAVVLPTTTRKGDLIIVCGTLLSGITNFAMGGANGGAWNSDLVSLGYFQWKVLTDTKSFTVTTNSTSDTISWAVFRGPTQYTRLQILANSGTDSFAGGVAKSASSKGIVVALASLTSTADASKINPTGVFTVATSINGASSCSYIDAAPSPSYPNGTTIKCPAAATGNTQTVLVELT